MKSPLQDHDIEYAMQENPLLLKEILEPLRNKMYIYIYIYMTSISTIMYIDKLDDVVNKYTDTYITNKIKMNSINVKSGKYIDFNQENNMEDPKFEVDNHVRISKYKNIFANGYAPNWREDVFVFKKKEICGNVF